MASFGRRPAKASQSRAPPVPPSGRPDALRRLREEEAEQERFAREFEERSAAGRRDVEELRHREAEERRCAAELVLARRGLPNPVVFLDVEVTGPTGIAAGRLEIELFADAVPRTAENFRCLCTGERGPELHFKGAKFHRIVPGFMAQGGDITNGDGTGGRSIYGPSFSDECFKRLHARANLLSMANSGPNSNNSQFFILFRQSKHLDKKHVVFGEIIREDGQVVKRMESLGSEDGSVNGSVRIVSCGELRGAEDEKASRERFRRSRSRTSSQDRQKKQRRCYI